MLPCARIVVLCVLLFLLTNTQLECDLNPGMYFMLIEGYQGNWGDFQLGISCGELFFFLFVTFFLLLQCEGEFSRVNLLSV